MRILLAATFAVLAAAPALADETTGVVTHFDPVTRTMTLADKTVWHLTLDAEALKDVVVGQRVLIDFISGGENGIAKVQSITRM